MKYPVIIHKDEDSAYGVTVPDIPGCFAGGDTLDEALANVQTAVEIYYDGEEVSVPPQASRIEDLVRSDLYTRDGFWVLADIDFSFLSPKTVRINVTIPEYKLLMIDKAAKKRGLSRSAFLVASAEQAISYQKDPMP